MKAIFSVLLVLLMGSSAFAVDRATALAAHNAAVNYLNNTAGPAKAAAIAAANAAAAAKDQAFTFRPACNDIPELVNGDNDMILYYELADGEEFCTSATAAGTHADELFNAASMRFDAADQEFDELDARANDSDPTNDPDGNEWQHCADEFDTAKDEWVESVTWWNLSTSYANSAKTKAQEAEAHYKAGNTGPGGAPYSFIEYITGPPAF